MKKVLISLFVLSFAVGCATSGTVAKKASAGKWVTKVTALNAPSRIVSNAKECDKGGMYAQSGCWGIAEWLQAKKDTSAWEAGMAACDAGLTYACSWAEKVKAGQTPSNELLDAAGMGN